MITATELRRQLAIYYWRKFINQLFKKPRWFIANLLNKHTDACWCDLILWAEFGGIERPYLPHRCTPGESYNQPPDNERYSGCYCGKFSTHHRRVGMVGEDD